MAVAQSADQAGVNGTAAAGQSAATAVQAETVAAPAVQRVDYRTEPAGYKHWTLTFDGAVATLGINIAEDGGIRDGYKLKLNSYDLGVDIELHDALQRIRFEHPEVRTVVVTSAKDRIFCSGANIFMLGLSIACVEGQLLQVHQRDAQRHRGLESRTPGSSSSPRCNGATRRRRLRAGAGVR